jgi:hypothetical protein
MNWYLVNYADENFKNQQEFLNKIHGEDFNLQSYTRSWLETTDFYQENKEILNDKVGAGWWIWKPYVILETMKNAQEGDLIVYCDCGDMFSPGLKSYVQSSIGEEDLCLLLVGNSKNKEFTKRDCFVLMDCDEEDYWNSAQLEAGFMVWKVSEKSKEIVSEWLRYCKDPRIINNDSSVLKEELPEFKEHRNDQSIITNLAVREGLSVGGPEYRNFVECDYDYWYERGSKGYGREIEQFLISIKDA